MKKILSLFSCLLLIGCGEKSSSEGSESASEKPTTPSVTPNSLNYAEAERLLKDAVHVDAVGQLLEQAVDLSSLRWVDGLAYLHNETEPFSGWIKQMYASGQVEALSHTDGFSTYWLENGQKQSEATYKDGEVDGLETVWHENGQKEYEGVTKDGNADGLWTYWHENGQKKSETTFKDGKELSAKYWDSKGEEVETWLEAAE